MSGCGSNDGCGCESPGLTRFEDALENLLSYAEKVSRQVTVPLNQALGKVLAEDQHSVRAYTPQSPRRDNAYVVYLRQGPTLT